MNRRAVALIAIALLVASACGSRLDEEQRAALTAGGAPVAGQPQSGGSLSVTTTTLGLDGSPATTPTGDAGGSDDPAAGAGGGSTDGGGATPGPAQPGSPATTAAPTAAANCNGGGATDVGVTDTEIKIGNVSTISGPIPGFGQTGVNAVKAYVNFVNSQGGLCGRQLTLVTSDDRLQSGTNKSETDKLKGEVFAFVGGISVVDDGSAQSLQGTNISDTSLGVAEAKIKLPNNFSPTPIDLAAGGNGVEEILKYMKATFGVTKAGVIWPAQATAKARAQGYITDMERAGLQVVLKTEVSVTETNYADDAAAVENAGVQLLMTTLEISGMARLAKAMDQNGYFPKVPFYGAQAYGRLFLEQAGGAAEATVLGLGYHIFEDRGSIKAVDDFLTWYELTNPGADIDFFALQSWVAADMFATAMRGLDAPPTRDALLAELQTFTSFDGSGFIAPINPAQKKGASCFVIAEVDGGKWKRTHPATPTFDCSFA